MREHRITAEEVESVAIRASSGAMKALCEPLDIKQNPRTIVDAQFSIPWAVAVVLAYGKVGLDAFTEQAIKDRAILTLSNKVTPKLDESLNKRGVTTAVVEIKTKDGKAYSKRVDNPYGSPENPMSMDAICEKFRDCASHAARPMRKDNMEKVIQLVSRLETVSDVRQVARLLGGPN
jgi:2-methylcitrate dehydratase PrpD